MAKLNDTLLRNSHFSQLDNWSPKKDSIPDLDFDSKLGMQSTSDKQK